MFRLDRRTRSDEERRPLAPHAFFTELFPGLASKHGHLVARGMSALGAPPLTIMVGEETWSLSGEGDAVALQAGAVDGALILRLTAEQFSDWAQNQLTLNGFLVARELNIANGTLAEVSSWDSLWICLIEGWPVAGDGLTFASRDGAPLNLEQIFGPQDDPAEIAHFLREAGYLRLRGWFAPEDMARISAEMDAALPDYSEGDGKSWWATLQDRSRRLVRMQAFVERSPTTARLLSSHEWEQLRRTLEGDDRLARLPVDGRIIEALIKPLGVVSGPSDLSFHRDCHLGRHAYACARMTVGVSLTPSGPENGQLRVVAGSHRLAMPVEVAKTRPYLPIVPLSTEPGDLTVHLSCTLHEATAPITSERRVLYTELPLAPRGCHGLVDTSVGELRARIDSLHRPER